MVILICENVACRLVVARYMHSDVPTKAASERHVFHIFLEQSICFPCCCGRFSQAHMSILAHKLSQVNSYASYLGYKYREHIQWKPYIQRKHGNPNVCRWIGCVRCEMERSIICKLNLARIMYLRYRNIPWRLSRPVPFPMEVSSRFERKNQSSRFEILLWVRRPVGR